MVISLNVIFNFILFIFSVFIWSFIINIFMFNSVLFGVAGSTLKNLLLNKIINNDFSWFNKLLFCFTIFILYISFFSGTIYSDSEVEVTINDIKFTIVGDYIETITHTFGGASAFIVGAKIAAGFVSKHPMSLPGKIGTTLLTGGLSSVSFQMINSTSGFIKVAGPHIAIKKGPLDKVTLELNDVVISGDSQSSSIPVNLFKKVAAGPECKSPNLE